MANLDPKEFCAVVKARGGKTYPDLVNSVALKNLPRDTAEAEGWPTYYMPEPCQFGHVSSRFTKNTQCVDCWRVKQGRDPLYPTAKNRTYRKQPEPKAPEGVGAPVIVAPAKPPEPSKREQEFLAALAMLGNFVDAAQAAGMTRGQVEARASVDPTFRTALTDLCERHGIPWTRTPDSKVFKWTTEIERQLVDRFIDTGLLEQARSDLGISASVYQQHLADSPEFAGMIDAARPPARETLKERALHAADRGNDRLLKSLENDLEEDFVRMPDGSKVRRLGNPDAMRAEMEELLSTLRRSLGSRERLREVCIERTQQRKGPPSQDSDLIEETLI